MRQHVFTGMADSHPHSFIASVDQITLSSVVSPPDANSIDHTMPAKSKAKRHGSLNSFDSFRISKPVARSNLKNVKGAIRNQEPSENIESAADASIHAPDSIDLSDKEPSQTQKEDPVEEIVERPQLDESEEEYIRAASAILDAKQTPIIHTKPNRIEIILRDFDLTSKYGPCVGISRLERWNRAVKMNMDPPAEVGRILLTQQAEDKSEYKNDLFYGRL